MKCLENLTWTLHFEVVERNSEEIAQMRLLNDEFQSRGKEKRQSLKRTVMAKFLINIVVYSLTLFFTKKIFWIFLNFGLIYIDFIHVFLFPFIWLFLRWVRCQICNHFQPLSFAIFDISLLFSFQIYVLDFIAIFPFFLRVSFLTVAFVD